ncbi:hypothetical protein [Paracoccus aminovorans]|uniref:hypothetical protein n=1 Tax=Paracoccus aminovorans TaxID=34004 RepID=UPI0011135496|nr:hypothetical protein [Paracoccus aminovorans]
MAARSGPLTNICLQIFAIGTGRTMSCPGVLFTSCLLAECGHSAGIISLSATHPRPAKGLFDHGQHAGD